MLIYLNSESMQVADDISLYSFLESRDFVSKKGIAVAINNCLVPKQEWDTKFLHEQDKILIISATKGG